MAIAAMSNVTHIEKREITALLKKFKESVTEDGNPHILKRTQFTEGLKFVGINQNDADIFDRLFTMYDKTGDDQIVFRDLIVGVCPLISGSLIEKIYFSFQMFCADDRDDDMIRETILRASDMINVLSQMNRVASYFGDPVLTDDQVTNLILDVVDIAGLSSDGLAALIDCSAHSKTIAEHPIVQLFISGGGTVQYGVSRS